MKKMRKSYVSKSDLETKRIGSDFSKNLRSGDVVAFFGELGSGKTTLIKGICEGFGIEKGVKSPSFVFLRIYKGEMILYHFDFYRLRRKEEMVNAGFDEFFYEGGVVLIEWADRVGELLPESRFDVRMRILSETEREIEISHTYRGER
jgi:tRNA threonylcarbamoyladenosine biosynthesis protein TsaE